MLIGGREINTASELLAHYHAVRSRLPSRESNFRRIRIHQTEPVSHPIPVEHSEPLPAVPSPPLVPFEPAMPPPECLDRIEDRSLDPALPLASEPGPGAQLRPPRHCRDGHLFSDNARRAGRPVPEDVGRSPAPDCIHDRQGADRDISRRDRPPCRSVRSYDRPPCSGAMAPGRRGGAATSGE